MLKLIAYFVAAVAVISGEVIEKTEDVQQEHEDVQKVVEQRSSFPAQSGCEHKGVLPSSLNLRSPYYGFIPPNWYNIHERYYPITPGGIFTNNHNVIPDSAEISSSSEEDRVVPKFRQPFVMCGSVPCHSNNIYNPLKFPFHNGVAAPYFNFVNGLYNHFPFPHYISSPYYNPIISLLYNKYSPYFGGVFPVGNTGAVFQPNHITNHVDSTVHHDPGHIVHKPEFVSTVSETMSETLPHGEEVIKETTKEITSNLHGHDDSPISHKPVVVHSVSHVISESGPHGEVVEKNKEVTSSSHIHHEPEVVNSVSHVITESGPHGQIVKETEEITSHSGNEFHDGHDHGHSHEHMPYGGNVIEKTKEVTHDGMHEPHGSAVVNSVSHVISESGPHGQIVKETEEITSHSGNEFHDGYDHGHGHEHMPYGGNVIEKTKEVTHDEMHTPHGSAVVNSVSHVISESGPHGQIVKETEEIRSHSGNDFHDGYDHGHSHEHMPYGGNVIEKTKEVSHDEMHTPHGSEVANSVSHVISESGPHGQIVKETEEISSHSGNEFHDGYDHGHGHEHMPFGGNVIEKTKEVTHDGMHIPHGSAIVNSVSHVISESGPHGEVVKETKEVTSNSDIPHEPEVVNSVSHMISESGPHGKIVKETKEVTSHSENGFHGSGYDHGHGYEHHLPYGGNAIQQSKGVTTNLQDGVHIPHGSAVVNSVSHLVSGSGPHGKVVTGINGFMNRRGHDSHGNGLGNLFGLL